VVRERKYFCCREFRHIAYNCGNRRNIKENRRVDIKGLEHQPSSNKFEVLSSKVLSVVLTSNRYL